MRSFRRYLIAAIALVVATAGCSSSHTTRPAASSATTTATNGPVTTTPPAVPGLTAEQLNAHLGVGVPARWSPVDEGDARIWVPNDWLVQPRGGCIGNTSAPGVIGIARLPRLNCHPTGAYPPPTQAAALIPWSRTAKGVPSLETHARYGLYTFHTNTHNATVYYADAPQLSIRLAAYGTLRSRIFDTLGPSARAVALDPAYEAVPNNWRSLIKSGVSLSIPTPWVGPTSEPWGCGGWPSRPGVYLPAPFTGDCGIATTTPATATHDGIAMSAPSLDASSEPTGQSIATLHHQTTTIRVYIERSDPNLLDLAVRKTGSPITHLLTLGLGRDGRVAGGVLASIRATT